MARALVQLDVRLLGLLLLVGVLLVTVAVQAGVRRLPPTIIAGEYNEVAGFLIAVVGVVYSVTPAFIVVVTGRGSGTPGTSSTGRPARGAASTRTPGAGRALRAVLVADPGDPGPESPVLGRHPREPRAVRARRPGLRPMTGPGGRSKRR